MPTLVTHWIHQCLTPSPHIIESPNLSLVQDLIFKHVLINIIRPIRHRWLITPSISQWLVATPNLVFSSPHCHIHGYAGVRTHTHICTYFFNMFTSHTSKTNEIPSSPVGVEFGSSQWFSNVNITHLTKTLFFFLGYYIHYLLSSSLW